MLCAVVGCWVADQSLSIRDLWHRVKEEKVSHWHRIVHKQIVCYNKVLCLRESAMYILALHFDSCVFAVTRVRSQGHVTVSLSVVTKDLWKQGYRNGASEPYSSGPSVVRDLSSAPSKPFPNHNRTVMWLRISSLQKDHFFTLHYCFVENPFRGKKNKRTKERPRRDSNPQSSDPKSDALSIRPRGPVEVSGRNLAIYNKLCPDLYFWASPTSLWALGSWTVGGCRRSVKPCTSFLARDRQFRYP